MMSAYTVFVSLVTLAAAGFPLFAQGEGTKKPYVAVIQSTDWAIDSQGKETALQSSTSIYARNRAGSLYQGPASSDAQGRWVLFDQPTRKVYALEPRRMSAREVGSFDPDFGGTASLSPDQARELAARTRVVHGVPCLAGPVRSQVEGGAVHVIGQACYSFELGRLKVHGDVTQVVNGRTVRTVTELVRLQADVEPNPEWFVVPPEFATSASRHPEPPARN